MEVCHAGTKTQSRSHYAALQGHSNHRAQRLMMFSTCVILVRVLLMQARLSGLYQTGHPYVLSDQQL